MDPQIELLSTVKINWPAFRATLDKALDSRPDRILSQYPVTFTEDAEFLLYLAYISGISISNPLDVLRTLPHHLLEHLHYTFMVACSTTTYEQFMFNTSLSIVSKHVDMSHILLVAGSMSKWFDAIVLNLTRDKFINNDTRLLLDKLLLAFEKQGLKELFSKFNKRPMKDGTFLLERK